MERFDDGLGGEFKSDLRLSTKESILVVDDRTTEEALDHGIFATDGDNDLDNALLNDVDLAERITWLNEHGIVRELRGVQAINDFIEDCVSVLQVGEER